MRQDVFTPMHEWMCGYEQDIICSYVMVDKIITQDEASTRQNKLLTQI